MAADQNLTVSVDRVIEAPAAAIFAMVSDAARHPEFDGSGSLVRVKGGGSHVLTLGSTFDMSMKMGLPYTMTNTVVEFEPDRRIAWQTVKSGPLGRWLGGRIWRYELEQVAGGTKVTETWDLTRDKQAFLLKNSKVRGQTSTSMSKTLDRLAEITEA
jgi:uncharacterized protein YndB with AHSA1/START domain